MALVNGQRVQCVLKKRNTNDDTMVGAPIYFDAVVQSDVGKRTNRYGGIYANTVSLVLRTDSTEIYEYKKDQVILATVEVMGMSLQVQSISYDYRHTSGLGLGRFTSEHNQRNAVKVVVLE